MKSNAAYLPPFHVFLQAIALALIAIVGMALAFSLVAPSTTTAFANALPAIHVVPPAMARPAAQLEIDEISPRTCCNHTQ